MPKQLRGDFQDLAARRQGVVEVLNLVLSGSDATVIAPMTVVEPRYFDETVGQLRRRGHDVRHTALLADRETVLRRLRERGPGHVVNAAMHLGGGLRHESFAVARLDRCLARLAQPHFAEPLWTDHRTVSEVA